MHDLAPAMTKTSGYLAIAAAVVVVGQVLYHSVARGTKVTTSPFALIAVAYAFGLCVVVAAGLAFRQFQPSQLVVRDTLVRGLLMGVAVAFVELGYIVAYKRGLAIGTGALSILAITSVALAPIGVVFFSERLSLRLVLGAVLAVGGVWIMRS